MSEPGLPAGADEVEVAGGIGGNGDHGTRAVATAGSAELPRLPEFSELPELPAVAEAAQAAENAGNAKAAHDAHASQGALDVRAAEAAADAEDRHLTRDLLWRFMDGRLSPAEMRHTFRHLLRGCASCRQQARDVWNLTLAADAAASSAHPASPVPAPAAVHDSLNPAALELVPNGDPDGPRAHDPSPANPAHPANAGNEASDAAYDAVLDRVFSRVTLEEAGLEAARRRAGALFEELMHHPPARQQMLVQNSSRFRDRMLCERLLAASHEEGFNDPARSQQLARIAVVVVERLAELAERSELTEAAELAERGEMRRMAAAETSDLLAGLRARTWAQLGNALRICSDHEGAAAVFRKAQAVLADHPRVGLIDKARVLDLEASLHRDRRQFAAATRLLDRVIGIYRRLGQSRLMGQALAQKGNVLLQAGDTQGSMVLLRRALELIDPQEDPRWHLIVRHNLIVATLDDGKPREAFALLFHARPLYLKMGERMHLLRLRWLEGLVADGLHRLEQAEAAFREVRDAFVELGVGYDAALVSLDLAAVYAQQGRTAETRRLAQEMLVFFESRQIPREAMTAFLIFYNAAQMEQAGLGLVREVAAFLKQARHMPDLRFVPSGGERDAS